MNAKDVEARAAAIRDWFVNCANYKKEEDWKAVIGISGGKDSSVAAALLAKAIGPEKVWGVQMPNGEQKDIRDSIDLVKFLGIHSMTVNIENPVDSLMFEIQHWEGRDYPEMCGFGEDPKVTTNLPARLRMCVLYAIANHINGRVIGTGNKSEKLVAYTTLWGDSACDIRVLDDLFVSEVIELGELLGLPERFTRKPPDDGMSGKTDEEKLGFTYDELEKFMKWNVLPHERACMIRDRVDGSSWKGRLVSGIPSIRDFMEV